MTYYVGTIKKITLLNENNFPRVYNTRVYNNM